MDCKQADKLIMQYGDNSLEPDDAKNLTKHLLICEHCREGFVAFDICLDETMEMEAPVDFTQNVMLRIKDMKAAKALLPQPSTQLKGLGFTAGPVQAAVGICAILLGALLFVALNFDYADGFFGSLLALVQYYGIAVIPLFESISASLSASAHFSQFTFVFVPVLSVLLFVLHSTEKDISSGDSVEA